MSDKNADIKCSLLVKAIGGIFLSQAAQTMLDDALGRLKVKGVYFTDKATLPLRPEPGSGRIEIVLKVTLLQGVSVPDNFEKILKDKYQKNLKINLSSGGKIPVYVEIDRTKEKAI